MVFSNDILVDLLETGKYTKKIFTQCFVPFAWISAIQ